MADKIKVWFDAEGDFLEVRFSDAAGYEKATGHDAVMERVDAQGRITGFSILGVSRFKKDKPLEADLALEGMECSVLALHDKPAKK
jgi:hypothetical protein